MEIPPCSDALKVYDEWIIKFYGNLREVSS